MFPSWSFKGTDPCFLFNTMYLGIIKNGVKLKKSYRTWFTCLCNIPWQVHCLWTGVVVSFFKKGSEDVFQHLGIMLLSLPENTDLNLRFRRNDAVFVLAVEHWTGSIPSTCCSGVYGSLSNQSTCVLWTKRKHWLMSLVASFGRSFKSLGSGAFC